MIVNRKKKKKRKDILAKSSGSTPCRRSTMNIRRSK